MSEELSAPRPTWGWLNAVLAALTALLLLGALFLWIKGPEVLPEARKADAVSRDYAAITKAAKETTTAFLDVDYQDMTPRVKRVLAGATGEFADQYKRATEQMISQLQENQSVGTGKVIEVGVGDLNKSDAVVFVAADQKVRNSTSKGQDVAKYYRFQLGMKKVGDQWKVATFGYLDGRDQAGQASPSASPTPQPSGGATNGQ